MIDTITKLGYSKVEAEELLKVSNNIDEDYEKLKNKYPIQYLIGYVNFYGYKLTVNNNVLIPRYETEYLVEKVIKYSNKVFNNEKVNILDLCTGSGAIGIVLSKEINSNVTVSDISSDALEVVKENIKINNTNINIVKSDLLDNINDKFDIIVCNPPYIAYDEKIDDSVKLYEPNIALYADDNGLYFYKKILDRIKDNLNKRFIIAFEIGYKQADNLIAYSNKYFKNEKIFVEKDLANKDRYLFIIHE